MGLARVRLAILRLKAEGSGLSDDKLVVFITSFSVYRHYNICLCVHLSVHTIHQIDRKNNNKKRQSKFRAMLCMKQRLRGYTRDSAEH